MEMFENDIKHAWIKHTSWRFKESRKMTKWAEKRHASEFGSNLKFEPSQEHPRNRISWIGSNQFPEFSENPFFRRFYIWKLFQTDLLGPQTFSTLGIRPKGYKRVF